VSAWEQEAQSWIAWAREPNHDAYWDYSPRFFELVPPPGRATLEIGCGEGRVARDLASLGHRVTGIDSSPTLLAAARELQPDADFVPADAADLPFPDESFDLAVSYNSLMDIDDMPGAVREAARVLEPGGRFCVCITHPFQDAGRFARQEADAPFVISGSYFGRRRFDETFERNGLSMRFRGWCYPLEDYSRAFEDAGLGIESLREPLQRDEAVAADPSEERWQRMPVFLVLRLRKLEPAHALSPAVAAP
jgi:SAM-dependent methyltransferase